MAIKFPTTSNSIYGAASITAFVPPNLNEAVKISTAPGVNGQIVLGMGNRETPATVVGVLITATATSMNTLHTNIRANVGSTGYLKDNYGRVYSALRMISFDCSGPRAGRSNGVQQPFQCVFVKAGY